MMKSLNEYPKWGYGCSGAVTETGDPYKKYCTDDDNYPWLKLCCQWSENQSKCIPKGGRKYLH